MTIPISQCKNIQMNMEAQDFQCCLFLRQDAIVWLLLTFFLTIDTEKLAATLVAVC